MFSEEQAKSTYGVWTTHFSNLKSQIYEIDGLVFLIFMIVAAWGLTQAEQSLLLISAAMPYKLLRINFRKTKGRSNITNLYNCGLNGQTL